MQIIYVLSYMRNLHNDDIAKDDDDDNADKNGSFSGDINVSLYAVFYP